MVKYENLSAADQEEIQADLRNMMESPAFEFLLQRAQERAIQKLLAEPVGSLTAASAHASMKALTELRGELQALLNDGLFKPKRR